MTLPTYISGLDLGQSADFSALVVVEKTFKPDPERTGFTLPHFAARHIHRWPLKTPYPNVVTDVKELFAVAPLKGSTLVVDKTGVGAAVCDLFAVADIGADLQPYQITAGFTPGDGTVPKRDLVSAVQATLQTRRLAIAKALEFAGVLAKELETFRVKITDDRNESYTAWRDRDHDDLVLALALAVWYGRPNDAGWPDGPQAALPDAFLGVPSSHGRGGGSATGW